GNGRLMTMMPFSFVPTGVPSVGDTTSASIPGKGMVAEPGLIGSKSSPYGLPKTGPPVSVCHMWSSTGTRSFNTFFCSHFHAGAFNTSPAQKTLSREEWSNLRGGSSPYFIKSRTAVGEVKTLVTPNSSTTCQKTSVPV